MSHLAVARSIPRFELVFPPFQSKSPIHTLALSDHFPNEHCQKSLLQPGFALLVCSRNSKHIVPNSWTHLPAAARDLPEISLLFKITLPHMGIYSAVFWLFRLIYRNKVSGTKMFLSSKLISWLQLFLHYLLPVPCFIFSSLLRKSLFCYRWFTC